MSDNTCNMTHRTLPPKLKFKVLNEAPLADLLKRPRSEQAEALVEVLATATEEYQARTSPRTRKRCQSRSKMGQ